MTDFAGQERDPLTRGSRSRRESILHGTRNYHCIVKRRWWVYCGCLPMIRGVRYEANRLGPMRREPVRLLEAAAMTRPPVPHEREIAKLRIAYSELSDRIVRTVKTRLPEGSVVHWSRRGYRQTGEVLAYLGFSADHLRLRVLNAATQRTSDVHFADIEECR